MTKVEALHEVITALGGTPEGTTVSECIAEITTIEGGAPTAGASTSEAIHELAVALGYEPGPTPPEPPEPEPPEPETVTLVFDAVVMGPVSFAREFPVGTPTALPTWAECEAAGWENEGKHVDGWTKDANGEGDPVDDPYTATKNESLYAIWTED